MVGLGLWHRRQQDPVGPTSAYEPRSAFPFCRLIVLFPLLMGCVDQNVDVAEIPAPGAELFSAQQSTRTTPSAARTLLELSCRAKTSPASLRGDELVTLQRELSQYQSEYDAFAQLVWAERSRPVSLRCIRSSIRVLVLLRVNAGVDTVDRFLREYFDEVSANNDILAIREFTVTYGDVVRFSSDPTVRELASSRLRKHLTDQWMTAANWYGATSAAARRLAAIESAKGAVLGMVQSGDADLLEYVAHLEAGAEEAKLLPEYFVESFRSVARKRMTDAR